MLHFAKGWVTDGWVEFPINHGLEDYFGFCITQLTTFGVCGNGIGSGDDISCRTRLTQEATHSHERRYAPEYAEDGNGDGWGYGFSHYDRTRIGKAGDGSGVLEHDSRLDPIEYRWR
jgi:hypothetical protein